MKRRIPLAIAGQAPLGYVDESGYIHSPDGWRLEWWIAGDDHWHVPAASPSLRQRAVDHTPVIETAIRVPGGDVLWRVGACAGADGGVIAAELENSATIPVAVGVAVVAPEHPHEPLVRPAVHFTAPARSVAAASGVELFVHPVTHHTTFRCSIGSTGPSALPPIAAIVRGWQALAGLGAQISLGDPVVDDALATARTSLLLHHQGRAVATALALLGYEDEAGKRRLAERLKPKRRGLPLVGGIDEQPVVTTDELDLLADADLAAATVAGVRARLVDDGTRRTVDLLPGAHDSWHGHSLDVKDLPTDHGAVSFALRWHGEHPALLWEAAPKVRLRATALDPEWSTGDQQGEALLGPRPRATGA